MTRKRCSEGSGEEATLATPSGTTVTVAITGASGALYGLSLIERLMRAGRAVALVVSKPGITVVRHELGLDFSSLQGVRAALSERLDNPACLQRLTWYAVNDFFTPLASGSTAPGQMVICPCSMATLGAIARGAGYNLIHRAADVILKENGRLLVMPRETPYSSIHLDNMATLVRAGARVMPLSPSFYQRPQTITELVDTVIDRALHHLDVAVPRRTLWYST